MISAIVNIVLFVNSVSRKLKGWSIGKVLLVVGFLAHTGVINLFAQVSCPAAALGYAYQKTISLQSSRVSGGADLMNFPVVISITDANLATRANGGHVENSNGYDVIFTDGSYNKLDHQVEIYTASNGNLIAWVRIPVLSATVNTTVLMLYGNPQITADPSVKTVWKSSYQGVWHMGDNPAGTAPQLKDAAQSNNGTQNGSMLVGDLVSGNIGNAIHFDGNNDYFDVGTGILPATNFSEECWLKAGNQSDAGYHGFLGFHPGVTVRRAPSLWIYSNNLIHGGFGDGSNWCLWTTPGSVINSNNVNWNHLVTTFNGTDYKLYVNGVEVYTDDTWAGRIPYNTPIQNIGRVDNYFRGDLDEIRVLSEALSPGWIATEYNNQSSPGTFYNIGGESICSVFSFSNICSGSPIAYSVPNTGGHSYTWSVTGGSPSSTSGNSITVNWNPAGPHSIHLTETAGCSGSSITYNVVVNAPPIGPTLNVKSPNLAAVCDGQTVFATFTSGSSGIGCTDKYEYRFDGGTWLSYTGGTNLNTAGHTLIEIQGQRSGCVSGCTGTTWVTLASWTVNPLPLGVSAPATQTVCSDAAITPIVLSTSNGVTGTTYTWTRDNTVNVTGIPATGSGDISGSLNNVTNIFQVVIFTITPNNLNGCVGNAFTATVIVNPTPQVIPSAFAQKICNEGTTSIVLTSPSTFSNGDITFDYTVVATGGVTGFTSPVTGLPKDYVISDILSNPTDAPQTVTYTIVPISPSGCAAGPSKVVVITVEPTPQVVPSTLAQTICNDGTTNIVLTSPSIFVNGVITFNYTVVATGGVTGFTTPVAGLPNGHIISDVLHNPTDAPQTVTYKVVPISPECSATDPIKIIVITVNPTPQVVPSTLTQTVCNDGTTNVTLGSPSTFTSGVITFNYTVLATGGVTGFTTPVTGLPKDHVIADILHNPTDGPQTVTYTIVPISPTGCASGPSKVVVIMVNPTPQVLPSTLLQTLCNDGTTSVTLGSPSTFSNGLITFNYSVVATGGVTGFTTPVTGLPKNHVISDILHNPTNAPQTVTYNIVPISPSGCASGPGKIVVITVNPTPQVVPGTLSQILCNDGTTNVSLGSPSTFTNGVITFNYTVVATGGVTGFTTPVTGLPKDYVISDILHNPTDVPQTVTYTIVPISPTGCAAGPSKEVIIRVNPTPQVVPSTLAQTICNDGTTNVTIDSPSTFSNGLITFNYTVIATGGVSGFVTPVTGLPKNHIIADILHNPTDGPQTVTYTIVPISPTGCTSGPSKEVVITVNPTPQVVPSTLLQILCNDGATNVTLGSPSTFSNGLITFNYSVVATGGVTGFTTPVTGLPKDHVISDILHNPTDAPQTVTYTIVPVSPSGCPSGPSKIVVITVNPTPQVVPSTLAQSLCNDGTTNVTLGSPSTFTSGVITFNYTVVATGGVTGFTTPVTGRPKDYVITDVLHNPTDSPQTVTYTIVPISPAGCAAGPSKVVVITVNPTPQVVPGTLAQTICNDGTTNVILGSPSTFSNGPIRFNYTVVATGGVTGFTTPVTGLPKDYILADLLHNPTDDPQTVTYTIVPVSPTGCAPGPSKIVIITINPTPRIFPIPANTIQCDNLTTNIQLQSPSTFTSGLITFRYTVTTTGLVTGYTTPVSGLQNNQIIADNLINQTDTFRIVTYRVVPVSPTGCSEGLARNITVTVNPTPRVIPLNPGNLKPDSSICYGGTTQIVLNSPTVMTSGAIRFDYNASATGGGVIVGNTAPEINRIPPYTISRTYQNNSDTIQSVYYYITPYNNAICVPGNQVRSEIKVHARALQSLIITKPLTCIGGPGLAALRAVISKGANPYQVVWDGPVGYHKVDSLDIANLSSGKYIVRVTDNRGCFRKDSVSIVPVTAHPYISALLIPPGNYNISCIGSNDGTILASVTGGITPPYNYTLLKNDVEVLYTGIFTNNIDLLDPTTYRYFNGLGAGSYTLILRDVNGCITSDKIIFRVPPPIIVGFGTSTYTGGYNVSCRGYNNGSAWIQTITGGRGEYTYRWYTSNGNIPGPINTNRIDNIIAGKYYLETKDILGCVKIDSVIITEPNGMQLTGSVLSHSPDGNFNISCNGGSEGSINMSISGGSGNYTYAWSGPGGFTATTKDISNLYAGVYSCIVRDINGCILIPSPVFTISEPAALALTSTTSVSNDGGYSINCNGGTGSVSLTVTGGSIGNYTYTWSTNTGSGIVPGQKDQSALTVGNYHIVIRDLNNCEISRDITLTQPPLLTTHLTAKNITCNPPGFSNGSIDLTVAGGVAPYTYLWSNGATSEDISGLSQGVYQVIVTYNNTCSRTDTIRVLLPPPLTYTKTLSDYNGYNISCSDLSNGFINITPTSGQPPLVYQWTGPGGFTASTEDISTLIAGQYHLQITDSNFCTVSETINLTEPGNLGIMKFNLSSSVAGGFNINCAGDSTGWINIEPMNQVGTVEYLWSDGIFGRTRTNLPAGDYSVIITDSNNCYSGSSITLTEPDSLNLTYEIIKPFCPDITDGELRLNVTGGEKGADYSYQWSNNSTSRNLTNIPSGLYSVIVTDLNGCQLKESINVDPVTEFCLVIPNGISPNGDLVNDIWNIGKIELYPQVEIRIFNRWGQTIWVSEKGYPRPWDGKSNGVALPIDSYHYIIDLHNGSKPILGNVTIVK